MDPDCSEESGYPSYEKLCHNLGAYITQQSNSITDVNTSFPDQWIYYGSGETRVHYYKERNT